jgi:hypothetical protein
MAMPRSASSAYARRWPVPFSLTAFLDIDIVSFDVRILFVLQGRLSVIFEPVRTMILGLSRHQAHNISKSVDSTDELNIPPFIRITPIDIYLCYNLLELATRKRAPLPARLSTLYQSLCYSMVLTENGTKSACIAGDEALCARIAIGLDGTILFWMVIW